MPRIYKLSQAGLKLLYKIRHHKGHGIHSPFVFNLITKVIEEKTPYYRYEDIKVHIDNNSNMVEKGTKYNLLSFRLINYFGAKHILEVGSGNGANTLYLTAPAKDIKCRCVETSIEKYTIAKQLYSSWNREIDLHTEDNLANITEKQDCIYIDLENYNQISEDMIKFLDSISYEKTFIIIKGIRTNKKNETLWKSISNMRRRTVKLDLFNVGILFFDRRLYRWDYQISF